VVGAARNFSTLNPTSSSHVVNVRDANADHTASTPPIRSADLIRTRPARL
jgi:hypothetical protein